jgi:hypothetical protein
VSTDVSEDHITSIFRVEEISSARNQQASKRYIPEDYTLSCSGFVNFCIKSRPTVVAFTLTRAVTINGFCQQNTSVKELEKYLIKLLTQHNN